MSNPTSQKIHKKFVRAAVRAFSLVELLVVIAVIGIIAAIAIPNIAGITGGASTAKNQRNAQSLASVFSAARAAGNTASYADVGAATAAISGNSTLTVGSATFSVPNLSGADLTGAQTYLSLSATDGTGQLIYNPNP